MRTPLKLSLFGLGLAAVFATAAVTANTVVPQSTVDNWSTPAGHAGMNENETTGEGDMEGMDHSGSGASALGLAQAENGFALTDVSAPAQVGETGELSLVVRDDDGQAVTDFDLEHEKELHLIVVRADGQQFRHVHPERAADGTWSIPWEWAEAGSYRVFADFVPGATGEGLTLSTTVSVSGEVEAQPATGPVTEVEVDGYTVTVTGDLVAGEGSPLTLSVSRDGEPVTELEPYLGAFGHLVALRDGDLAYLHVHPHGDAPAAGETSGPEVVFEATIPNPGRYLLYFDFQVDGQVHSAPLVLETTGGSTTSGSSDSSGSGEGEESEPQEEGGDHEHG
ncbi:heavy-metal-associated domain-containing protein [Brachybacterium sp. EF45031]|uniref:heavy-metal-associated domain-containing protein n=1 Tax=Brachybacterium sillae TaxID=2810536 RepID=UPI00217EE524|nr:heavy-metal-associated domain-containing protein [Brachybacterium sillae]MCS6711291.1 heavy-metal-associated domain-containing protein [Brachybacterium sillae]